MDASLMGVCYGGGGFCYAACLCSIPEHHFSFVMNYLGARLDNGDPLQYSCLENPMDMDGGAW